MGDVSGTPVANKTFIMAYFKHLGFFMTPRNRLDLRGVISPLNLLKCKSCLNSMGEGAVIEVLLADMDVVQDLKMIVHRSNDQVVYTRKKVDCVCIGIKKGSRNRNKKG